MFSHQQTATGIDLYKVLGLSATNRKAITTEDIRRAYKRMVLKFHPDKTGTSDVESFLQVQMAYEILSDKSKRYEYDTFYYSEEEEYTESKSYNSSSTSSFMDERTSSFMDERTSSFMDERTSSFMYERIYTTLCDTFARIILERTPLVMDWELDITIPYTISPDNIGKYIQLSYVRKCYFIQGNCIRFREKHETITIYIAPDIDYKEELIVCENHGNDKVIDGQLRTGALNIDIQVLGVS